MNPGTAQPEGMGCSDDLGVRRGTVSLGNQSIGWSVRDYSGMEMGRVSQHLMNCGLYVQLKSKVYIHLGWSH